MHPGALEVIVVAGNVIELLKVDITQIQVKKKKLGLSLPNIDITLFIYLNNIGDSV